MTEPKVVHEWVGGTGPITNLYRVDEHGAITCQNPNDESEYVKPNLYSVGLELARLAARVQELEAVAQTWGPSLRDAVAENQRLREALDQYKEDADEWKCSTCGEWQRPWQMYCNKEECREALKEKP